MSSHPHSDSGSDDSHRFSIVHSLEKGDGFAHIFVAILLLVLAIIILIVGTTTFVHDLFHPVIDPITGVGPTFGDTALAYLSSLLFGVIVLELLSTILTYIQARNLEATIKDFLVVALISSIRKILMVGAQSSLHTTTAEEFQKEAMGTVVSIIGILLLIGGLILLDKRMKAIQADAVHVALEQPDESSGKAHA